MKAELEQHFPDIDVSLIESSGGAFEVAHENRLIFSKKQTGRFPAPEEIFVAIA